MQKHASFSAGHYQIKFAPLPVSSDETLYFDRTPVALPYAEDFPVLHYHDRYEVGVCESGEGLFLSEGRFYSVSKGDFIFVEPGRCHYSRSLNQDEPCICRFSYFHAKTVKRLILLARGEGEKGKTAYQSTESAIPAVIRASEHPLATPWLFKITDVCKRGDLNGAAQAILALSAFFLEAQSIFEKAAPPASAWHRSDGAVAEISEYLSLHYDRSDTARELADRCHLSESQLRRRFLAVYGMPPIAYRNFLRCKIAAELLIRSAVSVSEIAERIGYTSSSDFYRAFKKIYGTSPAAYRSGGRD